MTDSPHRPDSGWGSRIHPATPATPIPPMRTRRHTERRINHPGRRVPLDSFRRTRSTTRATTRTRPGRTAPPIRRAVHHPSRGHPAGRLGGGCGCWRECRCSSYLASSSPWSSSAPPTNRPSLHHHRLRSPPSPPPRHLQPPRGGRRPRRPHGCRCRSRSPANPPPPARPDRADRTRRDGDRRLQRRRDRPRHQHHLRRHRRRAADGVQRHAAVEQAGPVGQARQLVRERQHHQLRPRTDVLDHRRGGCRRAPHRVGAHDLRGAGLGQG